MKHSILLSTFALSFLTCGLTLCSDHESDYKKSMQDAFTTHNAVQQINQKKEAEKYKNADKRRMQLLAKQPQPSTKKASAPIPGSAAYAKMKINK